MAVEIGKEYKKNLQRAVSLYRQGRFEEEAKLIEKVHGLFHPINCYSCLKRIEEKHVKIEENGEKIRFHKKCIDGLAKNQS
jgi:hypothetical protein